MRFDNSVKWHGDIAYGVTSNGLRFEYHPDISRTVRFVSADGKPICLSCGAELTYWGIFVKNRCSDHAKRN